MAARDTSKGTADCVPVPGYDFHRQATVVVRVGSRKVLVPGEDTMDGG